MEYVAISEHAEYRGVYGSGDDGWDRSYLAKTFDATSDKEAPDAARKSIGSSSRLLRVFAIAHEIPLEK